MANMGIWQNYLRPPKSVAEYDAEAVTARGNALGLQEQEGRINLLKQSQADDAAVRAAYQSAGGDQAKVVDSLTRGGQYKAVEAFKKSQLADEKVRADIAHVGAQTKQSGATAAKTEQETKFAAATQHAQALAGVNDPQDIVSYIDAGIQSGVFPAEKRELMLQKANQAPSVQAWVASQKQQAIPVLEDFKVKAEMSRAQLTADTQIRGQDIGANTARRGQDMTAGTAAAGRAQSAQQFGVTSGLSLDRLNFEQGISVADAGGPSQAAFTKQFGKVPPGYRWKPDGNAEAIPGGPADLKNNASTVAKVTDAQDVLSLLDQAGPLLDKSTGSYLGAAIDEAGRAVGGATGGAKAAAQLRALEGALISKMPKMSGPQSDKDVLLYKQMAGQIGDRTIPAEQKRAAMQTIREINNRHAGGAKPTSAMPPEDTQAREWATKNPGDPRAKQIMQRLGGG